MKKYNLKDMTGGWFVGDFEPVVLKSPDAEVSVKYYKAGDYEEKHYHKFAVEITVISSGHVKMNGIDYYTGDVVVIDRCEATDFSVIEDTITTVVKLPSIKGDKYLGEYDG